MRCEAGAECGSGIRADFDLEDRHLELTTELAAPDLSAFINDAGPADETLMLAYAAGDAPSFDRLYRRHKDAVFRYLLRGCSNRASAEEMLQDVWLSVIRARSGYQPTARFTTWLFQIAHNRLVDSYRSQRPQEELDENLPEDRPGPERIAIQQDMAAKLLRLISGLPLEQREAIVLHEERGLTLEEIADITGVGRETVKSRLRYALEKLRSGMANA